MSSTLTRGQIVTEALSLAGRSTELKQSANVWLNLFLQHAGITFRFPELRKTGAQQTLAMGSQTAPLPNDFGAGMEKQGMIFGADNKPIDEYSYEDFASQAGFPPANTGTGRPYFYLVDRNAGVFRFSTVADQAYPFIPTYFISPPLLSSETSDDGKKVWLDSDLINVEGLMWFIYKFTNDEREQAQEQRVYRLLTEWKRELVKMGGTSRVLPNPTRFKRVKFGSYFGP